MGDDEILFTGNPVYFYKISESLQEQKGYLHRAKDWDTSNPEWSGKIDLIAAGPKCCHVQFDSEDGEVYAQAVMDTYPWPQLQTVADSGRFFVIRIEKLSGEFELVGLGFHSRDDSRQFQESLQKYFNSKGSHSKNKRSSVNMEVSEQMKERKKPKPSSPTKKTEQQGDFSCSTCATKFMYQFQRDLHQRVHLRSFKCPYCSLRVMKRERLIKHIKVHELALRRQLIVDCRDCGEQYVTEQNYKVHLPLHQKSMLTCCLCDDWKYTLGRGTPKKTGLQHYDLHLQQMHSHVLQSEPAKIELADLGIEGEEGLVCYICSEKFQDLMNFTDHVTAHRSRGSNEATICQACLHCNATFSTSLELLQHIVRKHEMVSATPLTVPCSICTNKFLNKRSLNQHLWQAHTTLVCSICEKWSSSGTEEPASRLDTKEEFVKHMESMHHEKLVAKPVPDAKLGANSQVLIDSAVNETNEKDDPSVQIDQEAEHEEDFLPEGYAYLTGYDGSFQCYKCSLSFPTSYEMMLHWSSQHGFRHACSCNDCKLPLPYKKAWIDHRLKVHGLPCRVEGCTENNFKNQATLRSHTRTKHRSKECTLCMCKFKSFKGCAQHINESHAEAPLRVIIQCQVCYQKFKYAAGYRAHIIRHHQNLGCPMCSSWTFTGPISLGNKFLADHVVKTHTTAEAPEQVGDVQNTEELMDEDHVEEDDDDEATVG